MCGGFSIIRESSRLRTDHAPDDRAHPTVVQPGSPGLNFGCMKPCPRLVTLGLAHVLVAMVACAQAQTPPPPRKLVAIHAPQHDPLFVDSDSVQRRGEQIAFKYLLDVLAPDEASGVPSVWKSNEIEASIDCSKRTVTVRRLVAYSGRRGSGSPTAVHSVTAAGAKPAAIAPKSTFAYLEDHLCTTR